MTENSTRANTIDPISKNYLHDEVARQLRELIRSGEMKPQQRLNESQLAERFQISRTPLREAIKILSTEGLLDLLPNRGARVASISDSEIEEMLEVIAALESAGGELACRKITEAQFAEIAQMHDAMAAAYHDQNLTGYFELNRDIHEAIMDASGNATLKSIYANLSGRVQSARYAAHKTDEQWERAMSEHELMIRHLRNRDGVALGALMREHVRSKKAVIVATFGENPR